MGNNGSSHQHGLHEMGRGWTQSFPRELTRHHSQLSGHKVLPEPPNQRLRATDNGSIIYNGGTLSSRRLPTLTLPHDLNKHGVFRSRSTSASNIGLPRLRKGEHCCHYQNDPRCMDHEMQELKRFGSEPDLRYSPTERTSTRHRYNENRHCDGCYPERDSKERESRYKAKKKYKAPAPPSNGIGDGSSPDSFKWEVNLDRDGRPRAEEEIQPPPRRSRLFKTRAETKRAQVNSSSSSQLQQDRAGENCGENEGRWRHERSCKENGRPVGWRENQDNRDRWRRDEQRRSKLLEGKNTLQRSMSSPEFQAELMQVARKVRNKLNCGRRTVMPVTDSNLSSLTSLDRKMENERLSRERSPEVERKRNEKRTSRIQEVSFEDRRIETSRGVARIHEERRHILEKCNRMENKSFEDRRNDSSRESGRNKDFNNCSGDRQDNGSSSKRRMLEKSSEETNNSHESNRKPLKERLDAIGHLDDRFFSDKYKKEFNDDRHRTKDPGKNRKFDDPCHLTRTRSESPVRQCVKEKLDVRGQGSGRESTPEPPEFQVKAKENSDPRWRKNESRINRESKDNDERWAEPAIVVEKKDQKPKEKILRKPEDNWHVLPPPEKSAPKTFYFGMDEAPPSKESRATIEQQMEQMQSRLQIREISKSPDLATDDAADAKSGIEDISLKLRPTLPKKQLEIPRFSPSAAWRLLSALEAPGPTMSTASEEIPVMFEERIERLSRPPPPLVALGPRSSHDKSGDSGISGDAGAANDDSLDVSTTNRIKTPATRPTWTPQQDLGEESSSDAGVDSPPPMPTPVKFPPRPHVFSLSLPRDDNRLYIYNPESKNKEGSAFNSLQKLKRSVSGALGLAPLELDRKRTSDALDDNWLLSSSAPTSLQHNQIADVTRTSPSDWKPTFEDEDDEDEDDEEDDEDRTDFPVVMKPPSFSYLASGGHVMYLPDSSGNDYQPRSLNYRKNVENEKLENSSNQSSHKFMRNGSNKITKSSNSMTKSYNSRNETNDVDKVTKNSKNLGIFRERSFVNDTNSKSRSKFSNSNFSKSCENISEMKQRSDSPIGEQQNLQDNKETSSEIKATPKHNSKGRRFTFQSTVRQIERRRLAEKLSREAEAKERQRKGELEAMRKVEEEFQRKRAREKANIRQQLRLYNMDENLSSLPTVWDSSQLSRADPDGAPSSSASSPTSAPPGKLTTARKSSVSSDEYNRKRASNSDLRQPHQQQREYKDCRPKYYDWAPENSSHLDFKQTTVHPKVVCDIPKSSSVFVDANVHGNKTTNQNATPRSDNYRKDFAHGAVAAKSSLASSDSELSQPNTRPHSRQTGNKAKPLRSRSASPERSEEAATSEDESPVEAVKQERAPVNGFVLNGVQPFVREKSYRPITFNPQPPPPPIPS